MKNRKTITGKASTLRELRVRCQMRALKPEELSEFFVDTREGRYAGASVRKGLRHILEDSKDLGEQAKVLIYGHGGCGKSTELVQLSQDLAAEYSIVRFSINESGNAFKISPEELIVLLTEQIVSQIQNKGLEVAPKYLQSIYEYFFKESYVNTEALANEVGVTAEVGAKLSVLVKILAKVKDEMKLSSERRKKVVEEVRKSPDDLLNAVRLLVNEINHQLPGEQELLVIVEDLDKLDIKQARSIFVTEGMILTQIPTNIIYTIPVFLIRSEDAAVLENRYRHRLTLPMIKPMEQDGITRAQKGFETMKEVILKRIEESLITPEALDLVIAKTGGIPQHCFDILHHAALVDDAEIPLTVPIIKVALQRKQRQFWEEIGVPDALQDQLTNKDLYTRLAEIANNQLEGKRNVPSSALADQILMKQAAVIQYNGEGWLGVHPLVMDNLDARGDLNRTS